MGAMLEALFEILVVGVFRYPGALLLAALTLFRKPYHYWLTWGDGSLAGVVGIVGILLPIILLVKWL